MNNMQKNTDLTGLATKIVEKYYETYPETSMDIFTISALMLIAIEELENSTSVTKQDFPAIVSNIHKKYKATETDDILTGLLEDFNIFSKKNCKNSCSCKKEKNNIEPVSNMEENAETRKQEESKTHSSSAKTNIKDTETEKTIQILMPGVEKENISITIEDKHIVVKLKDLIYEYPFVNPKSRYEFPIDDNFDIENTTSSLKNGILTIVIPKKEKQKIIINVN